MDLGGVGATMPLNPSGVASGFFFETSLSHPEETYKKQAAAVAGRIVGRAAKKRAKHRGKKRRKANSTVNDESEEGD